MDFFNRSFFRFAFGFLGIIFISVTVILVVSALSHSGEDGGLCFIGCASAGR